MNVLVTGGAGYIGSHFVRALCDAGVAVVVLDDLSAGHADAVPEGVPFVRADVRDSETVRRTLEEHAIDSVVHFAARIQVGESVANPRKYYRDNTLATLELLDTAVDAGVRRIVFSSTAAVYGNPHTVPIPEEHPTLPTSPYGESKLFVEHILASYARAYGIAFAALRYFNAAGAHPDGSLGERHDPETHLVPLLLQCARGDRRSITLYGDDYPTRDGTCVRDYVHVCDLADAHLAALHYLEGGGESGAFNLGTGHGYTVREVIEAAEAVTGARIAVTVGPRRPGDPAELVASPRKAERLLGFRAQRSTLPTLLRDAWARCTREARASATRGSAVGPSPRGVAHAV